MGEPSERALMTSPHDDLIARRAAVAQELRSQRSSSLWTLTLVGVFLLPALIAAYAMFFNFFFIWEPPPAEQIDQGVVIIVVSCGVQSASALMVFVLAAKHRVGTAQVVITASWLLVCAYLTFAVLRSAARF